MSRAEALFRSDPRWLGGDAAYSLDLGKGRVLWLFGDSFVAAAPGSRGAAAMPRNTLAIEHGYDPSHATIDFHYRHDAAGVPTAWFAPPDASKWFWPGPAVRVGASLLVFLWQVRSTKTDALGFANDAPFAAIVSNPDDVPEAWVMKTFSLPSNPWGVFLGTGGAVSDGGFVYAMSCVEPGNHDVYLARWPVAEASRGAVDDPEWATDARGSFVRQSELTQSSRAPLRLFERGNTELSVHLDPTTKRFVVVHSMGFPVGDIVMRTAPALAGPWSEPRIVYRLPEGRAPQVLVYAAKAHPELTTPASKGAVVLTYATNSLHAATLTRDMTLYFPKLVTLDVATGAVAPLSP